MTNIKNYLDDGANFQAQAVLAFVRSGCDIEESWSDKFKKYEAKIKVGRWENCREQGYVLSMLTRNYKKQLNIAFFEHRNSDDIEAVKWEQTSINSLTIDTAKFGEIYKDKYDTSFSARCGEISKMSDWIIEQFTEFWKENDVEGK